MRTSPKLLLPVCFLLAALALFVIGTTARGLWNPDEPREAEIAREMWLRGDPVVVHLNGAPFLEKPPLYAWVSCGIFWLVGGAAPWSARLASNLAGACLVALTVRLALSSVDVGRASAAGLALVSMPLFWWHSSRANLDIPLALFVSMAIAAFFRAWRRSRSQGVPPGPYHDRALDVAALSTAAAFLTKGLVGIALPVLVLALFLLVERDLWFLLRLRWGRLIALLLVPVLAWLVPFALRDGGKLAYEMFVTHHVERFVKGFDHQNPWWHYLATFPTSTIPWLPLAAVGVWVSTRGRRDDEDSAAPLGRLAVAWIVAPLLFFSASVSKRDLYMLPSFPALALLVGLAVGGAPARRPLRLASTLGGLLSLALGAAFAWGALKVPRPGSASSEVLSCLTSGAPLALPALSLAWGVGGTASLACAVGRASGRASVLSIGLPALLTALIALGLAFPAIDPHKSGRALFETLAASDRLVGYRLREPDLGILTFVRADPIPLAQHATDLTALLSGGMRVVGAEVALATAVKDMKLAVRTVAAAPIGGERFSVIEADPPVPAQARLDLDSMGRKVALSLRSMVH